MVSLCSYGEQSFPYSNALSSTLLGAKRRDLRLKHEARSKALLLARC